MSSVFLSSEMDQFTSEVLACQSDTSPMYTEYVDWSGKEIHFSDIGFSLDVPRYAVPYGDLAKISICALVKGPFILPAGLELVSPVYFISATPEIVFKKELKLSLDHWARLKEDTKLSFVFAPFNTQSEGPNEFRVEENGVFFQHSGTTYSRHFCLGAIARWLCDFLCIPLPFAPNPVETSDSSESNGNRI